MIVEIAQSMDSPHFLGQLFDEIISIRNLPILLYLGSLSAFIVLGPLWVKRQIPDRVFELAFLCLPLVASILFVAFTDEVFTSLLQVRNLLEYGKYSFDTTTTTDASVSILFYLLVAILAMTGMPIPIAAWILGVLCLGLTAIALVRLLLYIECPRIIAAAIACFVAMSPFMLMTGFSGFESTLVGLLTVLALKSVIQELHQSTSVYLLLLALTRFDLAFVVALVAALIIYRGGFRLRSRLILLPLLAPLLLLAAWKMYYDYWIPTPMVAKSTGLSVRFVVSGLRELTTYLERNIPIAVLPMLLVPLMRAEVPASYKKCLNAMICFFIPLFVYSAVILWGGGDYLSSVVGNRYLVPLHIMLVILFAIVADQVLFQKIHAVISAWPTVAMLPVNAVLIVCLIGPTGIDRIVQLTISFNQSRFGDYTRVENYGAAANLLNAYLPHRIVIASTEISSFFYFWEGNYLPLFATANRTIALRGRGTADLLFKKVSAEPMQEQEPEITFWDAVREDALPLNYQKLFANIQLASERGANDRDITLMAVDELDPMQRSNMDGDLLSSRYRFRVIQTENLVVLVFVHQRFVSEFERLVGKHVTVLKR